MKIEILGMGCPKCKKTTQNAQMAVEELGIDAEIIKVEELDKITEYGVMMTPALVIDGEVKVAGKIPAKQEIMTWIKEKTNQ
ncbi:MAG: thioredoxin family protein [Candidatus Caldatribacteriota bacterium]|nr:thioredoxin family protein [Atribacterota bacterium]MDD4765122.1 thioredoxin family protein [Atribacterota bacterium]